MVPFAFCLELVYAHSLTHGYLTALPINMHDCTSETAAWGYINILTNL